MVRHSAFPQQLESLLDLPSCWCYILCYQDKLFMEVLVSENKGYMPYLGCVVKVNSRIKRDTKTPPLVSAPLGRGLNLQHGRSG